MNVTPVQKKSSRGKFWLLFFIICVLVFGGTGGWYYAAGKFEEAIGHAQQNLLQRGQITSCDNQQVRGYPFRIGLFCDGINFEDTTRMQSLASGAIRTAAQIYDPGKLVLEFDGPAHFSDAKRGNFKFEWESLRASMRASFDGIERTSIIGQNTIIHNKLRTNPLLDAETLEFHARKRRENDLEIALGGGNINLAVTPESESATSKPFNLLVEFTANEVFDLVQENQNLLAHIQDNGGSGHLSAFKLETPAGALLELKGPLSIDTNGQLSATLKISVTRLDLLINFIGKFLPDAKENMEQVELALSIFSNGTTSAKPSKFTLQIEKGNVFLGIISLGRIPPVL